MKPYFVVRTYASSSIMPSVVFSTDVINDAFLYCDIMHRADGGDYSVLQLVNFSKDGEV